jgi:hypothetical protein
MSQWGNTDDAANSVNWAPTSVKLAPNTANRDALFGNTTADAFITGLTVGQFGVDTNEIQAARAAGVASPAHAGWVLKTTGSGGRAGRVTYETLVAFSTLTGDSEDTSFPDVTIAITSQPSNARANTSAGQTNTFTVVATSTPTATLSYQWTYANGATIATGANVGNTTTTTLTVNSAVQTTNAAFRVAVSATGATTVTSSNATLTITT